MARFLIIAIAVLGLQSCKNDEVPDRIEPGIGITAAGGTLNIGDSLSDVTDRFGPPTVLRDMDDVGVRFTLPSINVAGFLSETDGDDVVTSLTLEEGFAGSTPGGSGLGSDESTVRADLGDPVTDSFTDNWWYHDDGLVLEWRDGAVTRIHVVPVLGDE